MGVVIEVLALLLIAIGIGAMVGSGITKRKMRQAHASTYIKLQFRKKGFDKIELVRPGSRIVLKLGNGIEYTFRVLDPGHLVVEVPEPFTVTDPDLHRIVEM